MRINIIIIIVVTILVSCNTNDRLGPNEPYAYAGPDQTCKVGQYVIFDATKSSGGRGGEITLYDWKQDENNPAKVNLKLITTGSIIAIGFVREGIYKFSLRVKSSMQFSEPDEVVVRVFPRENVIFECPNLEMSVRYALNKPNDELNESDLLSLDSVRCFTLADDVTSLKGIERCRNLKWLGMTLQKITDLTPLSVLTKLKRLDVDQNYEIEDLSPLSGLIQLEHLNINSNKISDISPLADLTKLKYLNFKYNEEICDISPLSDMKEIEELWMGFNSIDDITAVSGMINLKLLWICSCNVTDISPVSDLKNLHTIKFDYNPIGDISALKELSKLELLYLRSCEISDISVLENLLKISMIMLSGNKISDISPLVNNQGIGKGDFISLIGNPLNEKSLNDYIPELKERGVAISF